ncbi:MAG TPA: AAA family ATPase [Kofleriaceae bacterium]|nr:AAA family ATPase [Kofleriaceae bacterium]
MGQSAHKVERKLVDRLRALFAGARPDQLARCQLGPGMALERLHLDIGVRSAGKRIRLAGRFPVVVEPRRLGGDERLLIAYHPLRQEAWFPVDEGAPLGEQAALFFRHAWSGLTEDMLESYKATGKESLRAVSFTASVSALIDRLGRPDASRRLPPRPPADVLRHIGSDQTRRAVDRTLPGGRPREPYRAEMQLYLGGERRSSVAVVGPPGSGKSTIIARWIHDLLEAEGYELDRNYDRVHKVWQVSGQRIIAGMMYLGDWEQRCLDLLEECRRKRVILWIEDLHLLGRLGQTRESDRNLAELFRGPVARGELTMIGECTDEQLQRLEDDAPSFAGLFGRVRVAPTTARETLEMMVGEARELEQARRVAYHPFTFRAILEIGGSLQPWKAMPGKALDLLRGLADRAARARAPDSTERSEIAPGDVVRLLSSQTGLAASLLTSEEKLDESEVARSLSRRVIGQDVAIEAACDAVFRIRAGLTDPRRPFAVYLFTGPTGTGKTELAKTLAEYLFGDPSRLLRFDMSEYATADAVARLIGDRWAPEGQLTRRVRDQPFAVVLLDEIEKAHRSVVNLLLQLLDEGRLTDASGETASFHHTVIVMTSNLGVRSALPIGFGDATAGVMAEIDREVRAFFPPELFNRIDRVVPFSPLTPEAAEEIAGKELALLLGRRGLVERHIFVQPSRSVLRTIVARAFDARYGARTVKRWLEDQVGALLTEELTRSRRAEMQLARLYERRAAEADGDGERDGRRRRMVLHVEPLVEAEPTRDRLVLAPLLELPASKLRAHLGPAADRIADLLAGGALDRVAAAATHPGARYWFDLHRARLDELYRWLERNRTGGATDPELIEADSFGEYETVAGKQRRRLRTGELAPAMERASKEELLARIAEATFLVRCAPHLADPGAHDAWVELLRLGRGDEGDFAARRRELLDWMTEAYRATGMVEEVVPAADGAPHLLLRVSGLFARVAFAGEEGCHIWRSPAAEPQIVRLRVLDADAEAAAASLLAEHRARLREFEQALEDGREPLPENPERLLPAVRALSFQPPLRPGEVFPIELEDFRLHQIRTAHSVSPLHIFQQLWWISLAREARGEGAP